MTANSPTFPTTAAARTTPLLLSILWRKKSLPVIDLGALRGPHGLAFAGGKVWFTAEAAKAIGSYDPATKQIDWILGTGQDRTHMIYVFPSLNPIITSNVNSATISVIEKTSSSSGPPPPPGAPETHYTNQLDRNSYPRWQGFRRFRRFSRRQGNLGR